MSQAEPESGTSAPAEQQGSASRPPAVASRAQRILSYRTLWILALLVFALDFVTKLWIVRNLAYGAFGDAGGIKVIRGFLYIAHVGNTGAAWSLFRGQSVFLAALAAATLVSVFVWRHSLGLRDRVAQVSFGLLCGGIVGNLLDRLIYQHVVDFIDVRFGSYIYPTFNVADSGICVGVIIYLWHSLRNQE